MRYTHLLAALLLVSPVFGQGGFSGPGRYEIMNIKSGKVLDLDRNDQTTVIQFSPRGTDNQVWYIQPGPDGRFFFRNGMNGNALTALGGNGSPVQGTPFRGDPGQLWTIQPGKDGNAIITAATGRSLDIPDGTSRDGVRVQVFDSNGDSNQRFTLRRVGDDRYRPGWMGGDRGGRDGRDGRDSRGVITCASDDGRRHYCDADTRGGIQMTRQISGSACIQGQTWGYDQRGIWVDRGCRAEFSQGGGRR